MSMFFSKLQSTLVIKLLKKWSTSGYPMITAKAFKSLFECVGMNLKLKVLNNETD